MNRIIKENGAKKQTKISIQVEIPMLDASMKILTVIDCLPSHNFITFFIRPNRFIHAN